LIKHLTEVSGSSILRTISISGRDHVSTMEAKADTDLEPNSAWWQSFLRGSEYSIAAPKERPLQVADAFCGSGGLSLGVQLAAAVLGHSVKFLAAIDTDPLAIAVYRANLSQSRWEWR
jgi:DNA (cytosine-5)-methyltransferase 1